MRWTRCYRYHCVGSPAWLRVVLVHLRGQTVSMNEAHVAPTRFADRVEAGEFLAGELEAYAGDGNALVMGLLFGGVPVAAEVARILGLEVDALAVRRLVTPARSDVSYAALASYGELTSLKYVRRLWGPAREHFTEQVLAGVEDAARAALAEVRQRIIGDITLPVAGRTVILVDDGMASGAAMLAAMDVIRSAGAKRVVVAVPVAPTPARAEVEAEADEFICAISPKVFNTVSAFYSRFDAVNDDEVIALIPHL